MLQAEIDEHRATLEALSAEVFGGEESTAIDSPVPEEQATGEQTAAQPDAAANEAPPEVAPGGDQAGDAAPGDPEVAGPAPGDPELAEPAPGEQGGFLDDLLGGLASAQDAALDLLSGVNLPEMPDVILPEMPDLATVQAMAGEAMQLLSRLLVAVAIKDIALPLVFLWIAVKAAVPIARWLIGLGTADGSA